MSSHDEVFESLRKAVSNFLSFNKELSVKNAVYIPQGMPMTNIMAEDVDANDKTDNTEEDAQSETETDDGQDEMTYFEALKTFVFCIALPTWDTITDIQFIIQLLVPACYHNRFELSLTSYYIFSKYFSDYKGKMTLFRG